MEESKWEKLIKMVEKHNNEITIKQLNTYLQKYLGTGLTQFEKEFIWETYKVNENVEDNPD